MARILITWELGSGLGHLLPMVQTARALTREGHVVGLAVRDLANISKAFRYGDNWHWFQAPVWMNAKTQQLPPVSYADILLRQGFADPASLWGLVNGWRSLFDMFQPDLLIADYAPVSLLSVRGLPCRAMAVGTGFFYPPPVSPLPSLHEWHELSPQQLADMERQALDSANTLLHAADQPPMRHLHELFDLDACCLTVFPELDHYPQRVGARHTYTGPLLDEEAGISPVWPEHPGRKVFVYLHSTYPELPSLLRRLADGHWCVLAYIGDFNPQDWVQYASPSLSLAAGPVAMRAVLQVADAVICHGNMGTVSAALKYGTPLLCLPKNNEQHITAKRVEMLGYGRCITGNGCSETAIQVLEDILQNPSIAQNVRAFAQANTTFLSHHQPLQRIVDCCNRVIHH